MRVVHEARTPAEQQRLRAAAEAARAVRPPGIVRVIAIDESDDEDGSGDGTVLAVTTDEPDGPTIDGTAVAPRAFAALARALEGLHALDVAHGDVTETAIRLDATGRAVLPLPRWKGPAATPRHDLAALTQFAGVGRATSAAEVAAMLAADAAPAPLLGRRRRGAAPVVGAVVAASGAVLVAMALVLPPRTTPATTGARPLPAEPPPVAVTIPATTDRVVTVDGRRYVVGEPGDLVAVGRWDCAGRATPALVRPGTGDVFVFTEYGPGATVTPVTHLDHVTGAGRTVTTATDPADRSRTTMACDRLVVDTEDGPTIVVTQPADAAARPPRSPATGRAP